MKNISAIRDLLLPAVWGYAGKYKVDAKIEIDTKADCLIVSAWKTPLPPLGFAVPRWSIEDESYLKRFSGDLESLMKIVSEGVILPQEG